ncbi:hypothetical protein RJ641_031409 [Dillenia turbinata]|uniref:2Fe-2S ferredoxin-type domain-containing protein n=1 Tax=Dillenia turbinata TaxID=194707 RepID=A0AAN8VY16_9MAGN
MAIATLQRFASRFHSTPSLSLHSKYLIFRSSASSSSSSQSSSKKVSDRIVKLSAIDFDGKKREIVGLSGQTLLKALINHGLIDPASHRLEEIDACSAECEVNIAQEWLEKLPPPSYDEQYVLKRNSRARVLNKHSRLGCQVVLTPELQALIANDVVDKKIEGKAGKIFQVGLWEHLGQGFLERPETAEAKGER